MSNNILLIFVFGFISCGVEAQLPHSGECPQRTPLARAHLDARKLSSGVWYENQRTASLVEWPYKCIAFKIQPFFEHKSILRVTSIQRFTGNLTKLSLPLKAIDPEGRNGKITVTIPDFNLGNGIINPKQGDIPAQILALGINPTNSWAVIWSCRPFKDVHLHTESVWVITREREVDVKTFDKIREALISLNLEHLVMRDSMQNDCILEDEKEM